MHIYNIQSYNTYSIQSETNEALWMNSETFLPYKGKKKSSCHDSMTIYIIHEYDGLKSILLLGAACHVQINIHKDNILKNNNIKRL